MEKPFTLELSVTSASFDALDEAAREALSRLRSRATSCRMACPECLERLRGERRAR